MKKVYLSLISLGLFSAVNAQMKTVEMKKKSKISIESTNNNSKQNSENEKAIGDPIWSDDFSNSSKWEIGAANVQGQWQIINTTTPNSYMGNMASTTMSNGFGYFNGVQYLVAGNVDPQDATLKFTDTLDLSAYPAIELSFQERYRPFNSDQTWVEFSTNAGATWTGIEFNAEYTTNVPAIQTTKIQNVSSLIGGQDSVMIRFRWISPEDDNQYGSGYGWMVDDVKLIEASPNDLKLTEAYINMGGLGMQYSKIPADQSVNIESTFGAKVSNNGVNNQLTTLTITNPGAVGASSEVDIAGFSSDSLSYETPYILPSTVGTYNFNFALSSSNNTLGSTSDDSQVLPFAITDVDYANDYYDGTQGSLNGSFNGWSTMTGEQEIGTMFEIFANGSIGSIKVGVDYVATNSQSTYIGRVIKANLYSINTTDFTVMDKYPTIEHTITAQDFGTLVKLPFEFGQFPVTAGEVYLVTASSYEDQEVPVMFAGYTTKGNTLGVDGSDQSLFSLAAAYGNKVEAAVVRLDFTDYSGLNNLSNSANLSVYPNPTSGNVNVNYTLENNADVTVSVVDVAGKELYSVSEMAKAAGKYNTNVETSSFNSGVYYVTVSVNGVKSTTKLIKK